ncbi:MAG: hypothetical protein J6V22_02085 [Clostridia bacterium]|nr:hypothetical protein [Clostridia bacterium]
MNKKRILLIVLCAAIVLVGIAGGFGAYFWHHFIEWPGEPDRIEMYADFPEPQNLSQGNGKRVKVILLMGQSNATGVGRVAYLQQNIAAEQFAKYENGFDSVLINFSMDNNTNSSNGEFVNVNLGCSISPELFGPEVGMAEKLTEAWGEEEVIILKYTYSGTALYSQWLADGERGAIYSAMQKFVDTYMTFLRNQGYDARLGAVCWMQGESDACMENSAKRYYKAQSNFVSYLREDFSKYAEDGGICFIDAGISDSSLWPFYQTVNEAKEKMADDSNLNYYFSTIEAGLSYSLEPQEAPDLAHYDATSTLKLGHLFGEYVIAAYNEHNPK